MDKNSINSIRRTFPHGGVVLSGNLVSIAYPNPLDIEMTEVIREDGMAVFSELIAESTAFRFIMDPNRGLRIVFEFLYPINRGDLIYHPPLKQLLSYDDYLDRVSEGMVEQDISYNIGLDEIMDLDKDPSVPGFQKHKQWLSLVEAHEKLMPYLGFCGVEIGEPDYPGDEASIMYSFKSNKQRVLDFRDDSKVAFLNFIRVNREFEIDYAIGDGEALMEFTVGTDGD